MKSIKLAIYISAFTCLGLTGVFFHMDMKREFVVFQQAVNARTVGLGCLILSVALYLAARVIGVYSKYKVPGRG